MSTIKKSPETNGDSHEETDVEHEVFKAHVRRESMKSIPEMPEDMLPWLVGRVAANEVYQKSREAEVDAKLKAITDSQATVISNQVRLEAKIDEINQKAPGDKLKYGTLAAAVVGVLGVVLQHFGVEVGPIFKAILSM